MSGVTTGSAASAAAAAASSASAASRASASRASASAWAWASASACSRAAASATARCLGLASVGFGQRQCLGFEAGAFCGFFGFAGFGFGLRQCFGFDSGAFGRGFGFACFGFEAGAFGGFFRGAGFGLDFGLRLLGERTGSSFELRDGERFGFGVGAGLRFCLFVCDCLGVGDCFRLGLRVCFDFCLRPDGGFGLRDRVGLLASLGVGDGAGGGRDGGLDPERLLDGFRFGLLQRGGLERGFDATRLGFGLGAGLDLRLRGEGLVDALGLSLGVGARLLLGLLFGLRRGGGFECGVYPPRGLLGAALATDGRDRRFDCFRHGLGDRLGRDGRNGCRGRRLGNLGCDRFGDHRCGGCFRRDLGCRFGGVVEDAVEQGRRCCALALRLYGEPALAVRGGCRRRLGDRRDGRSCEVDEPVYRPGLDPRLGDDLDRNFGDDFGDRLGDDLGRCFDRDFGNRNLDDRFRDDFDRCNNSDFGDGLDDLLDGFGREVERQRFDDWRLGDGRRGNRVFVFLGIDGGCSLHRGGEHRLDAVGGSLRVAALLARRPLGSCDRFVHRFDDGFRLRELIELVDERGLLDDVGLGLRNNCSRDDFRFRDDFGFGKDDRFRDAFRFRDDFGFGNDFRFDDHRVDDGRCDDLGLGKDFRFDDHRVDDRRLDDFRLHDLAVRRVLPARARVARREAPASRARRWARGRR